MRVAIVGGTGDEGFGLALRLAKAGVGAVIGSRSEERGTEAAVKANERVGDVAVRVRGTSNERAVADADVILVTVPFAGQAEIYKSIRDAIPSNAVVCDATSPLASAIGRPAWQVLTPWEGSAAELANAILRKGTRLVSGFQTVSADALQDLERPMEGDVLLCGGDTDAKAKVGELVELIPSLRWVDAGPLSMARVVERLTAVLVSVNRAYGIKQSGFALTGREEWGAPPEKG